jgi:hypothetical protein
MLHFALDESSQSLFYSTDLEVDSKSNFQNGGHLLPYIEHEKPFHSDATITAKYRISSNKRRGAYFFQRSVGAALIRVRRLFECGAYFFQATLVTCRYTNFHQSRFIHNMNSTKCKNVRNIFSAFALYAISTMQKNLRPFSTTTSSERQLQARERSYKGERETGDCIQHCSNKRRGAYLSAALISFGGMWVRRLLECGAYLSAALI